MEQKMTEISSKLDILLQNQNKNRELLQDLHQLQISSASKPIFIPDGKKRNICIIGSGNWGSAISRYIARNAEKYGELFEKNVKMWVFEEEIPGKGKLSAIINQEHENVKYLPGIKLPENIIAEPDLAKASSNADLLVVVLPHQFLVKLLPIIKAQINKDCIAISLIKGFDFIDGRPFLLSEAIEKELGIECSVLMGANVANEVAQDQFCEATIGVPKTKSLTSGALWRQLFDEQQFRINVVENVSGVELCGGLKNVVALGAGFVDALHWGGNTKAAILRIGLDEMKAFIKKFYPDVPDYIFFESCGLADLITTCYGGRNRLCAEEFAKQNREGKNPENVWKLIEEDKLKGQKLQGTITCKDVASVLKAFKIQNEFPLFWNIHEIAFGNLPVQDIIKFNY